MFSIELRARRKTEEEGIGFAETSGRIVIGDFTETFAVPLGFWDEPDYSRSWRQAFQVLNANPHATSCLMTAMTDPSNSNFLVGWPMYREDEDVYIQNQLIFLDQIEGTFDPEAPWDSVRPRHTINEDGNKISEWITPMDSLREFFKLSTVAGRLR